MLGTGAARGRPCLRLMARVLCKRAISCPQVCTLATAILVSLSDKYPMLCQRLCESSCSEGTAPPILSWRLNGLPLTTPPSGEAAAEAHAHGLQLWQQCHAHKLTTFGMLWDTPHVPHCGMLDWCVRISAAAPTHISHFCGLGARASAQAAEDRVPRSAAEAGSFPQLPTRRDSRRRGLGAGRLGARQPG